jgi:hypothetical protein
VPIAQAGPPAKNAAPLQQACGVPAVSARHVLRKCVARCAAACASRSRFPGPACAPAVCPRRRARRRLTRSPRPPAAVSGSPPEEPVVSKTSGLLFERRLIEKALAVSARIAGLCGRRSARQGQHSACCLAGRACWPGARVRPSTHAQARC